MLAEVRVPEFIERGFHLAYSKDAGDFRFNVMVIFTVLAGVLFAASGHALILIFAAVTGCTAYYFYPLIERKPRIGGGEYGVFIDGFGLIAWRAIGDIKVVTYANRFNETDELQFCLNAPLDQALLVDWRHLPIWRLLMKLPWFMTPDNVVRIELAPFAPPADEIHRQFIRLWKYYR
jgi:hypothetical protein